MEPGSRLGNDAWTEQTSHSERSSAMVAECGVGDDVLLAITQHHERWDGTGYPEGLRAAEISAFACVLAIADTYAALRSPRPHRGALGPRMATDFIVGGCGVLFDPELVRAFARGIPQYALGRWVELNTGEAGAVVDPNIGHMRRPVVRVVLVKGVPFRRRSTSTCQSVRIPPAPSSRGKRRAGSREPSQIHLCTPESGTRVIEMSAEDRDNEGGAPATYSAGAERAALAVVVPGGRCNSDLRCAA